LTNLTRFLKTKNKGEIALMLTIVMLAAASIFYANKIADRIQMQEQAQVILWAKAIGEKAKILKLSNEIFLKLAEEERKKVEITSKATQLLANENHDENTTSLFLNIITLNNQIPLIQTDENFVITDFKNIEKNIQRGMVLDKPKYPDFFKYKPIEVFFSDKKNFIFYKESIIYQNISTLIDQSSDQFIGEITNNTSLLPIVLMDKNNKLIQSSNIPEDIKADRKKFDNYVLELTGSQEPIVLDIEPRNTKYLYYQSSNLASFIKWFPIVLYSVLAAILFLAFAAIRNVRKYEKNQIWVGMSKETAHQLGTPISSLSAWLEVLNENEALPEAQRNVVSEMKKDVSRLSLIADRFSKIGSKPKLDKINLHAILQTCFEYLRRRGSKKVHFELKEIPSNLYIEINSQLFEWVIENLVKNAFDSIHNEGAISIVTSYAKDLVYIDVCDSGKGIAPQDREKIFEPGFTTKKRGWGLGLSLCRRIIVEYFNGKIYVLSSKLNLGTTIRVELPLKTS
jgi:two-component system, sporulation sensor kinase D